MMTVETSWSSVKFDQLILVLNKLNQQGCLAQVDALNLELNNLKQKIDRVNEEREQLSVFHRVIQEVIAEIKNDINLVSDEVLRTLLLLLLEDYARDIKANIVASRPDDLLIKKAQLKNQRDKLSGRAQVCKVVLDQLKQI
jgi:hypothetical protein